MKRGFAASISPLWKRWVVYGLQSNLLVLSMRRDVYVEARRSRVVHSCGAFIRAQVHLNAGSCERLAPSGASFV